MTNNCYLRSKSGIWLNHNFIPGFEVLVSFGVGLATLRADQVEERHEDSESANDVTHLSEAKYLG